MRHTTRRLGVTAAIFAAGLGCAVFGLLRVHQFSPHDIWQMMRPERVVYLYHYTLAHYRINYFEYGFVKRGLLSNVFAGLHGQRWVDATLIFNLIFDAALAALAARFLARLWCKTGAPTAVVFSAATLFGSLGLINLGSDLGRFDFALLVILIASLWGIRRGAVIVPALLTAVALLTHEIYYFIGVPMVVALTLDRLRDADRSSAPDIARHLGPMAVAVGATALALIGWGAYEPGFEALSHHFGRFVFPAAVRAWTRPLDDNVTLVHQYWTHGIYTPFDIACVVMLWLLIGTLVIVLYRARRGASALILFAPLFVLPLYALGTDYARWCKLGFALLVIAIAFACRDRRLAYAALDRPRIRLLALPLVGLPFEPFGIEHAFQYLTH